MALFHKEQEKRAALFYIAECLRITTENTARMSGGGYIKVKLKDIFSPPPQETRTSDEIISKIKSKL